jgi:hypothetical protein
MVKTQSSKKLRFKAITLREEITRDAMHHGEDAVVGRAAAHGYYLGTGEITRDVMHHNGDKVIDRAAVHGYYLGIGEITRYVM